MDEDELAHRIALTGTVLLFTVGTAIAIVLDRRWSRWWKQNRPDAEIRASIERTRVGYHQKRVSAGEIAEVVGDVLEELGRALWREVKEEAG
jgi:hypothetical protein